MQYIIPFRKNVPFSLEAWEHLAGRMMEGEVVVMRNLKRVWCRWYPDLGTEKVRVGGQKSWGVTVRMAIDLERLRRVMDITFGVGVKKTRALRCGSGRVEIELGDAVFALDMDEVGAGMGEGAGNVLHLQYDGVTSMLCVIMQFTRTCVSTISDPVAQRIIANVKHIMVQLFASHIVALHTDFAYASSICTTARISGGIVTCILDKSDGVDAIHIPMVECSDLITAYNSV